MENRVYLIKWQQIGNSAILCYEDGDCLMITWDKFNQAFGAIISADKNTVIRDFPEYIYDATTD